MELSSGKIYVFCFLKRRYLLLVVFHLTRVFQNICIKTHLAIYSIYAFMLLQLKPKQNLKVFWSNCHFAYISIYVALCMTIFFLHTKFSFKQITNSQNELNYSWFGFHSEL